MYRKGERRKRRRKRGRTGGGGSNSCLGLGKMRYSGVMGTKWGVLYKVMKHPKIDCDVGYMIVQTH